MIDGRKVVVVLPAYNASATLERTWREIPRPLVDEVVLVDDASGDDTLAVAARLGITHILTHARNAGYGANQKTCYTDAPRRHAGQTLHSFGGAIKMHPQSHRVLVFGFCRLGGNVSLAAS